MPKNDENIDKEIALLKQAIENVSAALHSAMDVNMSGDNMVVFWRMQKYVDLLESEMNHF